MYEQLKMRHEFIRALRALFLQSFESGRWSLAAQLLVKYGQAEANKDADINRTETVTCLMSMLDSDQRGLSDEEAARVQHAKKSKAK